MSKTNVIARKTDEDITTYVERMMALRTSEGFVAARDALATADAAADEGDFRGRVGRAYRAGLLATGHATFIRGDVAVTAYKDVSDALLPDGVDTYAGRADSTLRECYRLGMAHTPERLDTFITRTTEAFGTPSSQVRQYVTFAENLRDGKLDKCSVQSMRDAVAARVKASADTAAAANRDKLRVASLVVEGGPGIDGITPAMWNGYTPAQLRDMRLWIGALEASWETRHADALAAATADAAAREASAQTGTASAPKVRKPRTRAAA